MNEIPSTAITEWFRKSNVAVPSHFNQSMMLRSSKRLNPYTLKATFRMLCTYHDNLRAIWDNGHLALREPACTGLVLVEEHDLRRSKDVNDDVLTIAERLQSSINIKEGPLVHVAHFHLPEYDAVLIIIHHLVVDGVSWRIITDDINNIYPQLLTGACNVRLPKIRCRFAEYAEQIHKWAESAQISGEISYWSDVVSHINEHTAGLPAPSGESGFITFQVDRQTTRRLLTDCISRYGAEINDLLLTALSRAWNKVSGQKHLALSMEGHGREQFGEQKLELERIVGWFTTIFPVFVDADVEDTAMHVKKTSETLHAIPSKGFGYGTLLHIAHREELSCNPQMTFNYLGSFEEGGNDGQLFSIDTGLPKGREVSPLNKAATSMSINCLISQGELKGGFDYDRAVLTDKAAKSLMDEFVRELYKL